MPEPQSGRRRVFFALWPDGAASGALHAAARAARKDCGGRAMCRETLHLTLAFLGAVDEAQLAAAQAVAEAIPGEPFDFALDRIGCWRHNRILWAGCSAVPAPLAVLAEGLGAGLRSAGFRLDERPFAPHVTLLRDTRCPETPPALDSPVDWAAREFVLVESRLSPKGADYAILARYAFGSARIDAS